HGEAGRDRSARVARCREARPRQAPLAAEASGRDPPRRRLPRWASVPPPPEVKRIADAGEGARDIPRGQPKCPLPRAAPEGAVGAGGGHSWSFTPASASTAPRTAEHRKRPALRRVSPAVPAPA